MLTYTKLVTLIVVTIVVAILAASMWQPEAGALVCGVSIVVLLLCIAFSGDNEE